MPPKDMEFSFSPLWIVGEKTGNKFELKEIQDVSLDTDVEFKEDNDRVVYKFDKYFCDRSISFNCENSWWDVSKIFTNNWRRMHGLKHMPYRKLFKVNKGYALVIYQKQRKYIQNKYSFEEWKKKKGIENIIDDTPGCE